VSQREAFDLDAMRAGVLRLSEAEMADLAWRIGEVMR
jgi:hypothetical protein